MERVRIVRLALVVGAIVAALVIPATVVANSSQAPGTVAPATVLSPDSYEDADDTTATAPALGEFTYHTLDSDSDQDWSKFTVEDTGTPYIFTTLTTAGQLGEPDMSVFEMLPSGEMNELAADGDYDTNWGTYDEMIFFVAPAPGTYYVLVEPNPYPEPAMTIGYKLMRTQGIARRVAGANRFKTAVEVSKLMYPEMANPWWGTGYSPDAVFVANAYDFPDALAGVVLASYYNSALLLTARDTLPWETAEEIKRLGMSSYWSYDTFEVVILGGEGAVGSAVESKLAELLPVTKVSRIAGASRHGTAAEIARAEYDYRDLGDTAFIVNARTFADALAAGPVAAFGGQTLLTTERDTLPDATADVIEELGITRCILVGGSSVITSDVASALESLSTTPTVERIAGGNRYETARLVAQFGIDEYGMNGYSSNADYGDWSGQSAVLVSGANFPDALSAGVMCWNMGSPMLLTSPWALSDEVGQFMDDNGPFFEPAYVIGGEAALSPTVFEAFTNYPFSWER